MVCASVVFVGTVQVRETLLPLRVARKSRTGFGSSSAGGSGGRGFPQLDAIIAAISSAAKLAVHVALAIRLKISRNIRRFRGVTPAGVTLCRLLNAYSRSLRVKRFALCLFLIIASFS